MESMDNDRQQLQWQKRQLILALVVSCLLAGVLASLAWLNHSRQLQSATRVYVPSLWLDNVHGKNAMNLGEIDVMVKEDGRLCRRYVFAVCSNSPDSFRIQLAYTTNVPFTYTFFKAAENDSRAGEKCVTVQAEGTEYGYYYGSTGLGGNPHQNIEATYHGYGVNPDVGPDSTEYIDYSKVHADANPTYWISEPQMFSGHQAGSSYVEYYVLEVTWPSTQTNTKETDMVYLMVQNVTDA